MELDKSLLFVFYCLQSSTFKWFYHFWSNIIIPDKSKIRCPSSLSFYDSVLSEFNFVLLKFLACIELDHLIVNLNHIFQVQAEIDDAFSFS